MPAGYHHQRAACAIQMTYPACPWVSRLSARTLSRAPSVILACEMCLSQLQAPQSVLGTTSTQTRDGVLVSKEALVV